MTFRDIGSIRFTETEVAEFCASIPAVVSVAERILLEAIRKDLMRIEIMQASEFLEALNFMQIAICG